MYQITSRDDGSVVATFQFDPYRFTMKEPNHPGVSTVLEGMKRREQMNKTAVEPPEENGSTSLEENQPPSDEFIVDRIHASLYDGYAVINVEDE